MSEAMTTTSEFWDMEAEQFWSTLSTKKDVTTFYNFYGMLCDAIQIHKTEASHRLFELLLFGRTNDAQLVSREDFDTLLVKFGPFGSLSTKLEIFCGFDCGFYYGRCTKDQSKSYLVKANPQSWLIRESSSQGAGWFSFDRVTLERKIKNIHTIQNSPTGLIVKVAQKDTEMELKFSGLKQLVEFMGEKRVIQQHFPYIDNSDFKGIQISSYKEPTGNARTKNEATYTTSIEVTTELNFFNFDI